MISRAAPWPKPARTGELTRLSTQDARAAPKPTWMPPDSKASHTVSMIHCADPGCARPASDAPTSTLVRAVGPTDNRVEPLNRTAARAGRKVAYRPVTNGMPASSA